MTDRSEAMADTLKFRVEGWWRQLRAPLGLPPDRARCGTAIEVPASPASPASLAGDDALFDTAPVGQLLLDGDDTVQRINAAGAALLGWRPAWIVGQPLQRWTPDGERQGLRDYLRRLRQSGQRGEHELHLRNREGRSLCVRLIGGISATTPSALHIVAVDNSGPEQVGRRLRGLQAELGHVLRLHTAGELATSLAHELNQPLGTVMLNCETALRLLQSGQHDGYELSEALSQATEAASFASEVLRHLRSFLRKDSNGRVSVEAASIVRDVAPLIAVDASDHDVRLSLDIADDLPPIDANAVQIKQVLANLSRNAIEAIGSSPQPRLGELLLRVGATADGGVRFSVEDNGPGLDEAARERVFTPFFTTKPQGMGMGLAISRSIVEAHGGRLWAESRPEGGSAFRFTLPAGEAEPT